MKEKILMLIIGILIGAVITAGCFLIFTKNNTNSNNQMGNPPSMSGNDINGGFNGGRGGPNGQGKPDGTSQTNSTSTSTSSNTTTE